MVLVPGRGPSAVLPVTNPRDRRLKAPSPLAEPNLPFLRWNGYRLWVPGRVCYGQSRQHSASRCIPAPRLIAAGCGAGIPAENYQASTTVLERVACRNGNRPGRINRSEGNMSEVQEIAVEGAEGNGEQPDTTEEGRYIPYGGGSMGWFENAGVLKNERGNNYTFYTIMAGDVVRARQFSRWGQNFNRRGEAAPRVRKETGITIVYGRDEVRGTTRDISLHGVRMQFLDEISLRKGQSIKVRLHHSGGDDVLLETSARVVWTERIGKIRPVWNVGITMDNLSSEQTEVMRSLLTEE